MKKVLPFFLTALILGGLIVGFFWFMSGEKEPAVETENIGAASPATGSVTPGLFLTIDFFTGSTTPLGYTATTTSATSTDTKVHEITAAKRVTVYFQRTGTYGNEGTSTFHLEVSQLASTTDDTHWIYYNKLIDNVTNSNSQHLTRVTFSALTGTSTKIYSLDLEHDMIKYIRCIVDETTDGDHSCKLLVQF